jgi:rhamnosyltransferase subunit B
MSRIVVTTLGTLGDLHPMSEIALELRQRGHDVVFVTHQVYQSKLEALGFEFHPMRPDFTAMNNPQEMARMMDLKTGQEHMMRQ